MAGWLCGRLLQNIADKNTTGVQVVYAVSGWTDLQQRNYSVQLVSKAKLEGTAATGTFELRARLGSGFWDVLAS